MSVLSDETLNVRLIYPHSESNPFDFGKLGYIYLIHYISENGEKAFAIHHCETEYVVIFDKDNDDNHTTMDKSEFCKKFNILSIYECTSPMPKSVVLHVALNSMENRDYYDILVGSFITKEYKKYHYTLENLIEKGFNPWFEKLKES